MTTIKTVKSILVRTIMIFMAVMIVTTIAILTEKLLKAREQR